jgi:hypothetical protein
MAWGSLNDPKQPKVLGTVELYNIVEAGMKKHYDRCHKRQPSQKNGI